MGKKPLRQLFKKIQPLHILLLGLLLVIISPVLLTREYFHFGFNSDTGSIGDTIGGTTAPIVGLLNAILVYWAFVQQIRVNENIQAQVDEQKENGLKTSNFNNLLVLVSRLESEFTSYYSIKQTYVGTKLNSTEKYDGHQAIYFDVSIAKPNEPDTDSEAAADIQKLLDFVEICIASVERSFLHDGDRNLLRLLIKQSYSSKMEPAFTSVIKRDMASLGVINPPHYYFSNQRTRILKHFKDLNI